MISLRAVHKRFAGCEAAAVAGVSLDIAEGEIVGIIGRSGAGKSTLIRLINALEKPDSGSIIVQGLAVETLAPAGLRQLRRKVAMIFQNFGLLSSRSVKDNVAFPLKLAGVAKPQRDVRRHVARSGRRDPAAGHRCRTFLRAAGRNRVTRS